jgi:hypothetical protein
MRNKITCCISTYNPSRSRPSLVTMSVKPRQSNRPASRQADIVLLDDNQVFADSIIFRLTHRKIVHYRDPRTFIHECAKYAKDISVCIDNHFGVAIPLSGVEVAEQLHALGFTRLYIVSGSYFEEGTLPPYVTLIKKTNLEVLDLL